MSDITTVRPMSRYRAFLIHLLSSAAVGTTVFLLVWHVWYPGALFELSGGRELATLVIGSDVVLGPLLTLVVFNAAKKSIRFDMAVIVLVQLGALAYGLYVVSVARPVLLVAAVDVVKVVTANDLADADWSGVDPALQPGLAGPRLVGAVPVSEQTDLTEEDWALLATGKDIELLPAQYRAYDAVRDTLRNRALPAGSEDIRKALSASRLEWAGLAPGPGQCIVPLLAKRGEGRFWIDCRTGAAIGLSR